MALLLYAFGSPLGRVRVFAHTVKPNNAPDDSPVRIKAVTLVAAYRSVGVPVLVGDFLISSGEDRGRGRKKISRVRDNLAIGWTGNLVQAEHVLGRLFEDLEETPTKESLEAWLSHPPVERLPEPNLKLVGWIAGGQGDFGFHWDAAAGQITWGEEWFVGSGGQSFEASSTGYRLLDPAADSQTKSALEASVAMLTHLNCIDRVAQDGHKIGVGGGYEVLYWSEDKGLFEYIDKVLYFILVSRLDKGGTLRGEPKLLRDSLTTYRAAIAGEHSVLTFSEGDDHDIWVMSAVGQPSSREEIFASLRSELDQPMDLKADYYGGLLAFAAPAPCPAVPWVGCPWDDPQVFKGGRGRFEFEISGGLIEEIYRQRRVAYAAEPTLLRAIPLKGQR